LSLARFREGNRLPRAVLRQWRTKSEYAILPPCPFSPAVSRSKTWRLAHRRGHGSNAVRVNQRGSMSSTPTIAISVIGVLHLGFMIGELYPWESPWIMRLVLQKWPKKLDLSPNDTDFVSMAVHNAGIYNGIVAVGLFSAALCRLPSISRSGRTLGRGYRRWSVRCKDPLQVSHWAGYLRRDSTRNSVVPWTVISIHGGSGYSWCCRIHIRRGAE
jgi:hypothetical protein